jgi:adenine/guanine phosphoribosyltransferase-like PRPP-binding protein
MTDVMHWIGQGILYLAALSAILTGVPVLIDLVENRRSDNLSLTRPLSLLRPITLSAFNRTLTAYKKRLEDSRIVFDVVVGIHYGGTAIAMLIGKHLYKPVRIIETHLRHVDGHPVCDSVTPLFNPEEVKGKRVLLVDNRIHKGKTLALSRKLLEDMGAHVTTLVAFRPASSNASALADTVLLTTSREFTDFLR